MSNEYLDWYNDLSESHKICIKYPFLIPRYADGEIDEGYSDEHIPLEIPHGWYKLFFQLCSDIKPILEKEGVLYDFYFIQVKEKYNKLICYYNNAPKEVGDIISRYEIMASYICCKCGKPAVFETTGYIASYCDDCFKDYVRHAKGEWIRFEPQYVQTTCKNGQKQDEIISFENEWNRYVKVNDYEV